jgi:hypothetical membrane protein
VAAFGLALLHFYVVLGALVALKNFEMMLELRNKTSNILVQPAPGMTDPSIMDPSIPDSTRTLARVAILGVSYFGLTILLLSLLDPDYNPISQAASDYGVGRFAIEMNLGFLVGGIGLIAFAWAVGRKGTPRRSMAGSVLFLIAGLVLIMDSYFTTNIEGGPVTLHGTIHGLGGLIFFITAPIGVLIVSRKFGRERVLMATAGLIVGFALLAVNAGLSGLAERIILLVIFTSIIVAASGLAGFPGSRFQSGS